MLASSFFFYSFRVVKTFASSIENRNDATDEAVLKSGFTVKTLTIQFYENYIVFNFYKCTHNQLTEYFKIYDLMIFKLNIFGFSQTERYKIHI